MKRYQVTVDVGSFHVVVEAENIACAEDIVIDQIDNGEHVPTDMWVATNETREIEEGV